MPSGNLWKVLGLCLLSDIERPDEDTQKTFKVSISGDKVELTCPEDPESEKMTWKRNDMQIYESYDNYMLLESFSEVENSGYYTCTVGEKTSHRLYLKARVCENCVEVDLMAVVTIIVVDICITLGLLLVVYYYSKSRKAKAMPVTRGAGAGGRPRGKTMEEIPAWGRGDVQPGPGWAASPSQVKIASIEHSTVWPHLRPLPSFPP
uniref:T-cell surface glycoprotein CD3 epsilon chain n=1 Tax=Sus scrofa TaxID=9823 RepID=A0A8D1UGS5_PIG